MKGEMYKKLKKKKQRKEFARITRKYGSKYSKSIVRGIIHQVSKNLIQVSVIEDFKFVESVIFPTKNVSKLRFNKNDKYYDKILKLEKIPKKLKIGSNPDLSNWGSFFKSFSAECIIIETENSKNRTFHIGGIIEVKKSKIRFLYFDAQGRVEKQPYSIKFKNITKITIDSNYTEIFKKYVRE